MGCMSSSFTAAFKKTFKPVDLLFFKNFLSAAAVCHEHNSPQSVQTVRDATLNSAAPKPLRAQHESPQTSFLIGALFCLQVQRTG